jgi:hypothetical protein
MDAIDVAVVSARLTNTPFVVVTPRTLTPWPFRTNRAMVFEETIELKPSITARSRRVLFSDGESVSLRYEYIQRRGRLARRRWSSRSSYIPRETWSSAVAKIVRLLEGDGPISR